MTGTRLCDRCWELESRIQTDPALVQKILGNSDGLLDELRRVKAERDAWAAQYQKAQQEAAVAIGQRDQRTSERDALAERLRGAPAMRDIVGELRTAKDWLADGAHSLALKRLTELLRRIDLESQT